MNVFIEVIGYIGTILVVASMAMTSISKLRILNISGSVLSTIYAIVTSAWPIVLMNVSIICINIYRLVRLKSGKDADGRLQTKKGET